MAASINDLDRYEKEATVYYFLWFTIYVVLGASAIALPALAAMDVNFGIPNGSKYFAGVGSIAAALFGFVKPNDYATAFDSAIAELRSLRFSFDTLTQEAKAKRFDNIVRLMAFKYHGVPASHPGDVP